MNLNLVPVCLLLPFSVILFIDLEDTRIIFTVNISYSLLIINTMRNRYIGVTLLAALGFTACQHLYSREIADDHDEVLRIHNEINHLRRELVAIKGMFKINTFKNPFS